MIWLVLGLLLWRGARFFKRAFPRQRSKMGKAGAGVVVALIVASIVLMVIGYGDAKFVYLYEFPREIWHVNNFLMLVAIFFMDVGKVNGIIRTMVRHPMLLGVVIWTVAHLLVNGDLASLILFGGLGLWAMAEMVIINRAEGPWSPPARGHISKDLRGVALAMILYAIIVGVHYWMGYSVIEAFN